MAIPHATVDGLEEALEVLGVAPEGVPFQSADGQPARILICLVIPRKSAQTHIRTLAGIAQLLQYEEMRYALQLIKDEEKKETP